LKRRISNPSLEQIELAERVGKARALAIKELRGLHDRLATLQEQLKNKPEPLAKKTCISKMGDLKDASRLRERELKQLFPDRIKKQLNKQSAAPKSSMNGVAVAKVTWGKPYRR
jgi:hypothetical protein